MKAPDFSPIGI